MTEPAPTPPADPNPDTGAALDGSDMHLYVGEYVVAGLPHGHLLHSLFKATIVRARDDQWSVRTSYGNQYVTRNGDRPHRTIYAAYADDYCMDFPTALRVARRLVEQATTPDGLTYRDILARDAAKAATR